MVERLISIAIKCAIGAFLAVVVMFVIVVLVATLKAMSMFQIIRAIGLFVVIPAVFGLLVAVVSNKLHQS